MTEDAALFEIMYLYNYTQKWQDGHREPYARAYWHDGMRFVVEKVEGRTRSLTSEELNQRIRQYYVNGIKIGINLTPTGSEKSYHSCPSLINLILPQGREIPMVIPMQAVCTSGKLVAHSTITWKLTSRGAEWEVRTRDNTWHDWTEMRGKRGISLRTAVLRLCRQRDQRKSCLGANRDPMAPVNDTQTW